MSEKSKVDKMLEEAGIKPMTPDHPEYVEEGETIVLFIKKQPEPEPESDD